jgi:cysteine sulfinate desulfinase/cysteine desulfurase-like protein
MAMGRSEHAALGSFRLSLGRWITSSDIEQAAQALNQAVRSLPANGEPLQ